MVTRRTRKHVKETPKQPSQTIVSIEWLPCLCIDAANHHEIYKKYCNDLGRGSNFGVSLELSWQPKGDLARQSQRPPMQIQSALNMHTNIYIYIHTIFAIAVCLGSTYMLIYTWSTNWYNEYNMFQEVIGQRTLACIYQDHLSKPMELQKQTAKNKVHLPELWSFIWSKM